MKVTTEVLITGWECDPAKISIAIKSPLTLGQSKTFVRRYDLLLGDGTTYSAHNRATIDSSADNCQGTWCWRTTKDKTENPPDQFIDMFPILDAMVLDHPVLCALADYYGIDLPDPDTDEGDEDEQ